jgi:hypothetical protein
MQGQWMQRKRWEPHMKRKFSCHWKPLRMASPSFIHWLLPNVQRSSCKVLWCVCSLNEIALWWRISPHSWHAWPQEDYQNTQETSRCQWDVWLLGLHAEPLVKLWWCKRVCVRACVHVRMFIEQMSQQNHIKQLFLTTDIDTSQKRTDDQYT